MDELSSQFQIFVQEFKKSKNPSQEMSKSFTDQDLQPNRILVVTIHTMIYPITEEVLHQVFSPYGFVEKIVILEETVSCQALIQFQSHQNAVDAMNSLQGRNIYDGCCRLAIQISNFNEEFQPSQSSLSFKPMGSYPQQKC
ncbi:polypyrimidine tract-binding protein homolog 3-like [Asparagus officinalis]|uniref:polypyrimidine tract-binding protein homolog 3-like n=1 Tax=Asparagus officinalis TaxID=4686 RepID=UPI00098E3077|nr:polypyrimidine tract-binding protein homolog 3-like [Asparagus officinalis]